MKDSEFIELLNLYLDHEISAADAVRLESEVQSNAARRRIYQDYCRMQKACKVLTQDFETEAPAGSEEKVVPFKSVVAARATRGNNFYTIGAFAAAAACVAIILVGHSRRQSANESATQVMVAEAAPVAARPQSVAAVKPTPVSIDTPESRVRAAGNAVASNGLRRSSDPAVSATFMGANALFLRTGGSTAQAVPASATNSASDQFAWLHTNLGLVPLEQHLQLEQLRFQTTPIALQPDGRAFGSAESRALGNRALRSQEPATEMVIFQFQR